MIGSKHIVWLVGILLADPALAAPVARAAPRVVNVTTDSAPGWTPSVDLERQARQTAIEFLTASDSGEAERAFGLLAPELQRETTFPTFTAKLRRFNSEAGASLERRLTVLTWSKDPANAPAPGVYAAFDMINRFTSVGRHCGYIVLYEPPGSDTFRVTRTEANYITDANFNAVGGEATWTKLSKNCPNYVAAESAVAPLPEANTDPATHVSVAATLAALKAQPGIAFRTQDGWAVAEDKTNATFWSFPPVGNPAYPSVVKRTVAKEKDGSTSMNMEVNCEATKAACDNLVRDFQALTERIKAELGGKH